MVVSVRPLQFRFHYDNVRLSKNRGLALVSALWLVLLLSTVAINLSREMQLAIKTTSIYSHEIQAKALVEGAVYESIYRLNGGQQNSQIRQNLIADGFAIEIDEAQSQTDLNAATFEQIEKLLQSNNIAAYTSLAERIVDFRDRDDENRDGEKENEIYLDSGLPYEAKNNEFQHILELGQIPGMPTDIITKLSRYLTVFGASGNGRVVTLRVARSHGNIRATANVTVQIIGGKKYLYKILNWDWTAS